MGILAWIVLGFVSGLLARAIVPGGRGMGCLMTTAVGVLGALIGGAIASAAGVGELESFFDLGTWAIAVLGAVLLLLVLGAIGGRSRRGRPEPFPGPGGRRVGCPHGLERGRHG